MENSSTITLEEYNREVSKLHGVIHHLEEQLAWLKKQLFGRKSERIISLPDGQQLYFDGFEELSRPDAPPSTLVKPHERKPRQPTGEDAITLPNDLPVERQVIDIPEEDKICPETGKPLVKIGEEVTTKLAHRPGSYFIKEIVRPKYGLPQGSSGGVVTADLPDGLLIRCMADESLLAQLLVEKFADHQPIYRQSEKMAREGIYISRQQLNKWMLRAGMALKPIYDLMLTAILESGNIFYDETPLKMLKPGKGKTHQAYMWVIAGGLSSNPAYRIYDFATNRRHINAATMLRHYSGVLHSDKYGAYEALARRETITWAPCWAHIRRKFIEAETGDPPFRDWVLKKIGDLFKLEEAVWMLPEQERIHKRQKEAIPIINELTTAIQKRLTDGNILPKSKFREALTYFCGLIPYLKNYTKFAWARLDNNVAERAVRPLAIGRKNWLFVGNEQGGETAGIVLSLVQSCRACGVNPREYLEDVMRRMMSHSASKLYELLPDQWAAARAAPISLSA